MTTYVVPCGISILDGIEKGDNAPHQGVSGRRDAIEELTRAADDLHRVTSDSDVGRWLDLCARHAGPLRLPEWAARVCAETDTLAARTDRDDPRPELPDDSVVLLATDTPKGMLSAFLVATWLTGGNAELIRFGQTPNPDRSRAIQPRGEYTVHPGLATVIRIVGLTPRRRDGFRSGTYGLGDVLRHVRDDTREPIEVHLSGGYKATLLHTLSLAEILNSTARDNQPVSAWYLHEEDQPARLPRDATRIGLRRFSPGMIKRMAQEVDTARRDPRELVRTTDALLTDVILSDPDRPPRELNAFGYGYLALLPPYQGSNAEGSARGW